MKVKKSRLVALVTRGLGNVASGPQHLRYFF
jgi:hypothetical protein